MPELVLCPGAPLSWEQVPQNRLSPWVDSTHLHVPLGPHTWTLEKWCVSQAFLGHHTNSDSCFLMARTFQEQRVKSKSTRLTDGKCSISQHLLFMWVFVLGEGQLRTQIPHKQRWYSEVSELSGAFPKRGSLLTLYDPRTALIKTLFFPPVIYLTRSSSKISMGLKPEALKQNFIHPSHLYLRSPLGWCGWPHEAPNKHFWHGSQQTLQHEAGRGVIKIKDVTLSPAFLSLRPAEQGAVENWEEERDLQSDCGFFLKEHFLNYTVSERTWRRMVLTQENHSAPILSDATRMRVKKRSYSHPRTHRRKEESHHTASCGNFLRPTVMEATEQKRQQCGLLRLAEMPGSKSQIYHL